MNDTDIFDLAVDLVVKHHNKLWNDFLYEPSYNLCLIFDYVLTTEVLLNLDLDLTILKQLVSDIQFLMEVKPLGNHPELCAYIDNRISLLELDYAKKGSYNVSPKAI